MKYLIDTHILIWLALSPERISKNIIQIIENPLNEIHVSTINLWEIAIKLSVKKLDIQNLEIDDLIEMCHEQNIKIVELPISAIKKYKNLPIKENHKDPFDRILVSLSIAENYTFLSSDSKINQYEKDGLKVLS